MDDEAKLPRAWSALHLGRICRADAAKLLRPNLALPSIGINALTGYALNGDAEWRRAYSLWENDKQRDYEVQGCGSEHHPGDSITFFHSFIQSSPPPVELDRYSS